MNRVATRESLRAAIADARARGLRIGFVPTMGYLHAGHLSLIEHARARSDLVVMSIFVNPLQFGPGEDLAKYPRDLERDAALAREGGIDILFTPDVAEVYPRGGVDILISAPKLAQRLCGAFRPGHFEGVLTVVAKLFHMVDPDVAVFGSKDFQQAALIRRMAEDLDFPVEVVAAPIVRDADGLALSSRNVYLSAEERGQALLLSRALRAAQAAFARGTVDADALISGVRTTLGTSPLVRTQYVELVNADTLDAVNVATAGDVLALAAFVGGTRLIDNTVLEAG